MWPRWRLTLEYLCTLCTVIVLVKSVVSTKLPVCPEVTLAAPQPALKLRLSLHVLCHMCRVTVSGLLKSNQQLQFEWSQIAISGIASSCNKVIT